MPSLQLGALELAYPSGHQCQALSFMVLIIDGQRRTTKAAPFTWLVGSRKQAVGSWEWGERLSHISMQSAWEKSRLLWNEVCTCYGGSFGDTTVKIVFYKTQLAQVLWQHLMSIENVGSVVVICSIAPRSNWNKQQNKKCWYKEQWYIKTQRVLFPGQLLASGA